MKSEFNKERLGSRYSERSKRRKTNIILNSLIAIVVILIIFVSSLIFSSKNDDASKDLGTNNNNNEQSEQLNRQEDNSNSELENEQLSSGFIGDDNYNENYINNNDGNSHQNSSEAMGNSQLQITDGDAEANIRRTIINPAWQPLGTEQTGEHVTVFDKDSLDWLEMERAIAYATEIERPNLQIWFIGNDGHNKAIGTVSEKNDDQAYRVYIEWVDGQGWKPTKVEELIENDKKGNRPKEEQANAENQN